MAYLERWVALRQEVARLKDAKKKGRSTKDLKRNVGERRKELERFRVK